MARQARAKAPTAAERKRREAQASANGAAPEGAVAVDGVVVQKVVDPEKPGELQIAVSSVGECSQLEWITLLEMGLRAARSQIGLAG